MSKIHDIRSATVFVQRDEAFALAKAPVLQRRHNRPHCIAQAKIPKSENGSLGVKAAGYGWAQKYGLQSAQF
jgi:hypothetical protein